MTTTLSAMKNNVQKEIQLYLPNMQERKDHHRSHQDSVQQM